MSPQNDDGQQQIMTYPTLEQRQELALGVLLKRLTDRLYSTIDQVYRDCGVNFQGSWFAPLVSIAASGSQSITELANEIGLSHPAITHISKQLLEADLVHESADPADGRRRLLSITPAGEQLLRELKPVWDGITETTRDYFARTGHDVFAALKAYEKQLDKGDLHADTLAAIQHHRQTSVEIIDYQPELAKDFYELNVEWLKKYFFIEALDEKILSDPEKAIIQPGGVIIFARYQQQIVGTCALIASVPGHYEIAKMAVTDQYQGLGIGRKLLHAIIERFHQLKGKQLTLETNRKLETAVGLYRAAGFVPVPPPEGEKVYQRADLHMVYQPAKQINHS